jgi:hypothetical protein
LSTRRKFDEELTAGRIELGRLAGDEFLKLVGRHGRGNQLGATGIIHGVRRKKVNPHGQNRHGLPLPNELMGNRTSSKHLVAVRRNTAGSGRESFFHSLGITARVNAMYRFPDHNFMLVVLDQLLETGSFVTDLDRLKRLPALQSRLNGESNYGSTIPEMDDFFRGVQLTQDDLEQVTELWFDGGNDIYHLVRPFWSGTDDDFDVKSVDGFERLTNLRIVHHHAMISDSEVDRFRAAGIECV